MLNVVKEWLRAVGNGRPTLRGGALPEGMKTGLGWVAIATQTGQVMAVLPMPTGIGSDLPTLGGIGTMIDVIEIVREYLMAAIMEIVNNPIIEVGVVILGMIWR